MREVVRSSSTRWPRAAAPIELVPFGSFSLPPHWYLGVSTVAGLADGSPDAGVGVQITYVL